MSPGPNATLLPELALAAETGARLIAGIDEVGRGALAGPVTVGVTVIDLTSLAEQVSPVTGIWPALEGVRDSKLLSAASRQRWRPQVEQHVTAYSVQHSSAAAIDASGITAALGSAGRAGLAAVQEQLWNQRGAEVDVVLLDGVHDWLRAEIPVRTMAKADTLALSVACASVLAKVERDTLMAELAAEHPEYGWESNRGYGSAAHREALRAVGTTPHHRQSWNLGMDTLPGL